MKNNILKTQAFEAHAAEYDAWYDNYQQVFKSEVAATRHMMASCVSYIYDLQSAFRETNRVLQRGSLVENLNEIREFEPAKPGFGEGSFVVIKAIKK